VLRWFARYGLLDGDDFRDRLCHGFGQARDRDADVWLGFSPGERRGVRDQSGFTGFGIAVADCEAEPPFSAVFAVAPKPTASGPAA
jgi:hypothetical protein